MNRFVSLLASSFAFLFWACSFDYSANRAFFEVSKPPNIHSNERPLQAGKNFIAAVEFKAGETHTVALPNLFDSAGQEAEGFYFLPGRSLGWQFGGMKKDSGAVFFWGGLAGYQEDVLFAALPFGWNFKHFEVGAAALVGLSIDDLKIEGDGVNTFNDLNIYPAAYLFASAYWNGLALSWSGSLWRPWIFEQTKTFKYSNEYVYFPDTLRFPLLFMHDFGVSYTYSHLKFRIGTNVVVGTTMPGRYWGMSGQAAWLW
jgi:hypothetical protein